MLKAESDKPEEKRDLGKIIQFNARQTALKIIANAGYGVFGREEFDFSDYRVSELITGYGRLIHKQLQKIALEKYGLETIFGFTDSIFIKNASVEIIKELIQECKTTCHVTLEHKNRFINTIVFDKKNRIIAWTGNPLDKPIVKNLDGTTGRYPKWIKQNIVKIATYIITNPHSDDYLSTIKSLIEDAFSDLEKGKVNIEDLAFFTKLSKEPEEYKNENDKMKVLAAISGAHKGDLILWYEIISDSDDKRKKHAYSNRPENLNLEKYKRLLLSKLKDVLEIIGFDMEDLKSKLAGLMTFQSA